jgi:hypothetical protein
VIDYIKRGGKAIQDWRFGEFLPDGSWTQDWANEVFGIEGISWEGSDGVYLSDGMAHSIPYYPEKQQFNIAHFATKDGYDLRFTRIDDQFKKTLLFGENTVVLGFQPQLYRLLDQTRTVDWDNMLLDIVDELVSKNNVD